MKPYHQCWLVASHEVSCTKTVLLRKIFLKNIGFEEEILGHLSRINRERHSIPWPVTLVCIFQTYPSYMLSVHYPQPSTVSVELLSKIPWNKNIREKNPPGFQYRSDLLLNGNLHYGSQNCYWKKIIACTSEKNYHMYWQRDIFCNEEAGGGWYLPTRSSWQK